MRSAEVLSEAWASGAPAVPPRVVPLGDAATVEQVGPKASNLATLQAAGFAVPRGVVLTTAAFESFLREANLLPEWEHLQASLDPARELPEDATFSVWRTRVRSAAFPAALRMELEDLLKSCGLAQAGFAVRASALAAAAEDGAPTGEALLNVVGAAALERAIRRTWASLWDPRRIEQLRAESSRQLPCPAVLLLEQVAAEISGTITTANPTTGVDDEAVVVSVLGLHDRAITGRARPDRFVASLWTGAARSADIGLKSLRVLPASGGGTRDELLAPEVARAPSLSRSQLRQLVQVAAAVHERAGRPVRLGFAFAQERIVLLDGRPLDQLRFAPGLGEWRRSAEVVVRGRELKTQLASSLHAAALQQSVTELAAEAGVALRRLPFHRTLFGRLYWNVGEAKRASVAAGLAALNEAALRWRTALRPLWTYARQRRRAAAFLVRSRQELTAFELDAAHLRALPDETFATAFQRLSHGLLAATESLLISTAAKLFLAEAALRRSLPGAHSFSPLGRGEQGALVARARELEAMARGVGWRSRWVVRVRSRRVVRLAEVHLQLQLQLARARVLLRRWSREAGRRLSSAGALERGEHVVHLGLEEVVAGLQRALPAEALRGRAEWNRRIHRAFRNFDAPAAVDPAHPLRRRGDELLTL